LPIFTGEKSDVEDQISISKTLKIRDCGLKEDWLQDQIEADPSILGLGDLEVVRREKKQSSGGRLDFLLQNSDDGSMYEVEVMLGETDASHIVRTIEYWDLERRRWPKRSHTAVLVAENMNRRFFNVIQILSLTIPIIAIQANIVEADGKRILNFTTILRAYEEPEEESSGVVGIFDEHWWRSNKPTNVLNAEALVAVTGYPLEMGFTKNYVSLCVDGSHYFTFRARSGNKSLLSFWSSDADLLKITDILDGDSIPYDTKPYSSGGQNVRLNVDQKMIQSKPDLFKKLSAIVKQSMENEPRAE
jgi:hypothetical protein